MSSVSLEIFGFASDVILSGNNRGRLKMELPIKTKVDTLQLDARVYKSEKKERLRQVLQILCTVKIDTDFLDTSK